MRITQWEFNNSTLIKTISMILLQYSRLDEGEYMGFGLSGDDERTKMVGGDVTIAWMDHATGKFFSSA